MSYDTHCSSCGRPYSDFGPEGVKSCECHKMAAQAVRDFVFDKPALSAAPVAQEPVIWQTDLSLMPKDREFLVKMSDGHYHVARFIGAEKKSMIVGGAFGFDRTEKIVAWRDINTNPPATSAGLGAEKLRELASCLDRALGDTDPSINPDYTDDEIKRDYPVFWVCQQLNAILALLSRAGDQSNSTHEA